MAVPRIDKPWRALGTLLLAGLLGVAAASQAERTNLPIVIDAASSEGSLPNNTLVMHDVTISQGDLRIRADKASVVGGLNYQNSKWTVSGSVRINAQGGSLVSDEAVVIFSNNVITRATITGAPAEFEGVREGASEPTRGRARTIDYETTTGNVSLRDQAWLLVDGCNELSSEQLVYNLRSQSVQNDGRVRITIQPQTDAGKPCSAPGKKP
ncbi:MAG TPA: LptA/OstA family protein [Steroidobacteraceae bacterium]|jgi:lipopolysaccharide transport protein LptA|nr:LptA/OstA family protein [Steroidobacteraceae bacterium]